MPIKKTQTKKISKTIHTDRIKKYCLLDHASLLLGILLLALLFLIAGPRWFSLLTKGSEKTPLENVAILKDIQAGKQVLSFQGKTWILTEGTPIEVFIVNDKTCGQSCDTTKSIETLKKGLSPALVIKELDIKSSEGKKLKEQFNISFVPAFILGKGFTDLQKNGIKAVDQLKGIMTEKKGLYFIDSRKVAFPIGKLLTLPVFDNANDPSFGTGKISVVEFTDFQCPYSARFNKATNEILMKLANEGKITYTIKDFPLSFHPESMTAHTAMRCLYSLGGKEIYADAKNSVFENQILWSGKGNEETKKFFLNLAKEKKVNIKKFETCLTDSATNNAIQKDIENGKSQNVTGTPTIFIGKQMFPGVIGQDIIERALQEESSDTTKKQ